MGRSLPFKVCFAMLARQSYAYVFRQVAQSLCLTLHLARQDTERPTTTTSHAYSDYGTSLCDSTSD